MVYISEIKDTKVSDLTSEALFVGALFKSPILYVEYAELIKSKYDFEDPSTKFLYDCFDLYYQTFSQEISETKINMFMGQDKDRNLKYRKIGGWKLIEKQMELTDVDDIKNYFDLIKKFSLIREYGRKGFPVQKLLNYKKFDKMNADDIVRFLRYNVDNIHTVIGGGKSSVILGSSMEQQIIKWMEAPDMGSPFPWDIWTSLFRGLRRKKIIIDGMLSNEGKSRRMFNLVSHLGVLLHKPMVVLINEQSQDEAEAALITTVANSKAFDFCLNKPEREIVLGEYKDDEEFQKVVEVAKYIQDNSKIYFLEMNSYSDDDLEREIKKHVLGLNVEIAVYDTLKGYKTDQWETVKQTTTKLKDLAQELNIACYATIQLTDDSLYTNVEDFSSMNIANAKQLKHVVDHMVLEKKIPLNLYDKYLIKSGDFGERPLDRNKVYYGQKIDKNRAGGKGMTLVTEVDLDLNTWVEVGYLIKSH